MRGKLISTHIAMEVRTQERSRVLRLGAGFATASSTSATGPSAAGADEPDPPVPRARVAAAGASCGSSPEAGWRAFALPLPPDCPFAAGLALRCAIGVDLAVREGPARGASAAHVPGRRRPPAAGASLDEACGGAATSADTETDGSGSAGEELVGRAAAGKEGADVRNAALHESSRG